MNKKILGIVGLTLAGLVILGRGYLFYKDHKLFPVLDTPELPESPKSPELPEDDTSPLKGGRKSKKSKKIRSKKIRSKKSKSRRK